MKSKHVFPYIKIDIDFIFRFITISSLYTPIFSGIEDNIFITKSYDATSHFETVADEVHDVWRRVTGSELVLRKRDAVLGQ